MHGRGRGVAGPMGRGRLMPNKQNLRVVECKPQPCVVSVEGLSSSTTDAQLKSLLMSVGPIQVGFLWGGSGTTVGHLPKGTLWWPMCVLKWYWRRKMHICCAHWIPELCLRPKLCRCLILNVRKETLQLSKLEFTRAHISVHVLFVIMS
jgi:hypothetical protein